MEIEIQKYRGALQFKRNGLYNADKIIRNYRNDLRTEKHGLNHRSSSLLLRFSKTSHKNFWQDCLIEFRNANLRIWFHIDNAVVLSILLIHKEYIKSSHTYIYNKIFLFSNFLAFLFIRCWFPVLNQNCNFFDAISAIWIYRSYLNQCLLLEPEL